MIRQHLITVNRRKGIVRVDRKVWADYSHRSPTERRELALATAAELERYGDGRGHLNYIWQNA
jgi:hypothetical protein